jgi:conjugative transfer pilus assembly protein TraH
MNTAHKLTCLALGTLSLCTANAGGLNSVLDGMFSNVTAPNVVSNQFRGAISGGGVYVRAPLSNIQVLALDPPRLSSGCGGIDLYLGAFSFITADKLTQFIRNTAQNAAPLAFKMALDANFPQLGGVLDKFQTMSQTMNDSQRNSCQLAHGIADGSKDFDGTMKSLNQAVTDGVAAVSGWTDDFTKAFTDDQASPSTNLARARQTKNTDGTQVISKLGNVTWNALNVRKSSGYVYAITDDPVMAQQVLLSLLGTVVSREGASDAAAPINKSFAPMRLRLKDLFSPVTGTSGKKEVPIWSCQGDVADCLSPVASTFETSGIEGYVRNKMFGSETATDALPGSIVYNMVNCTTANCGMTTVQLTFLNAIGKVPAVGLMMRAQNAPGLIGHIAPDLIDSMVDQISILYGRSILDVAVTSYSGTDLPQPEGYSVTLKNLMDDLAEVERAGKVNLSRMNTMTQFIDSAIRANGSILRYRAR